MIVRPPISTPTDTPFPDTSLFRSLVMIPRLGTGKVGKAFGPVLLWWFIVLGVSGIRHIVQQPQILAALNPLHAWDFLVSRGWKMFAAMSAIVLALTGAEALYADLGHFGRQPIQLAWVSVVLPGARKSVV